MTPKVTLITGVTGQTPESVEKITRLSQAWSKAIGRSPANPS